MILWGLVNIKVSYKCHVHVKAKKKACRNCSLKKARLSLQTLIALIKCAFLVTTLCFS